MHIEQFDPAADHARLDACYRLYEAASAVDDPNGPRILQSAGPLPATPVRGLLQGRRSFAGWWSVGLDGHPQQVWLATEASGAPVGCCLVELPERDYTGIAFCFVVVAPQVRRRGIGKALLAHVARDAGHAGRAVLVGETGNTSAGARFASAVGAQPGGTVDQRRVLDLGAGVAARLASLRVVAEQKASGYSLLSWSAPTPEADAGRLAAVFQAIADAPRPGSLAPEQWDAQRVRAEEARVAASGLTLHAVAARHDETGDLAALTQVCRDPLLPGWAFQLLTAVRREHRGHRLGLLVKAASHQCLVERHPEVRRIMTTNDASNAHMIAVNDQLGYRVTDSFVSWELPLAEVR